MRKKPVQTRSKQMVDLLVQATADTIAEVGFADATTNQVAARAGVSIGSLYQYFGDKDALVSALADRVGHELAAVVDARLTAVLDQDTRAVASALLTGIFELLEGNGVYLELARHWGELHTTRTIPLLEQHMLEACRQYFMRHHGRLRVENLPAALFVVISSTLYTVVHYLSAPRPYLRREELVASLSDMIAMYMERPPATTKAKPRIAKAPATRAATRRSRRV